jgi:hypothetical protein
MAVASVLYVRLPGRLQGFTGPVCSGHALEPWLQSLAGSACSCYAGRLPLVPLAPGTVHHIFFRVGRDS